MTLVFFFSEKFPIGIPYREIPIGTLVFCFFSFLKIPYREIPIVTLVCFFRKNSLKGNPYRDFSLFFSEKFPIGIPYREIPIGAVRPAVKKNVDFSTQKNLGTIGVLMVPK